MLSHGISSASNRLRRVKSSSSTQIVQYLPIEPKVIDPAIARQDAIAAASVAFERASERATATQEIKERNKGQIFTPNNRVAQHLGRKHSVRFTGPMSVLTKDQPITGRVAQDQIPKSCSPREGINTSQATDTLLTYQLDSCVKSLPRMEEDYPGSCVSSVPSSYRKLRKARSMFIPRSHRPVLVTSETQKKSVQANRQLPCSSIPRLCRSFSFLRGDSDTLTSNVDSKAIQDTTGQIARDRHRLDLENQTLEKEQFYLAPRNHLKPQKVFRKTVRTSSINRSRSPTLISSGPVGKKGFGHKARGFSLSLKKKLKQVFHRSLDTEVVFPIQQIDASRPHFGDYMSTFSGVDQRYQSIPLPDCEIIRKVSSRGSVCLDVPIVLGKKSHPGSIRSVRSDDEISNSKSRVTSWTNSTAGNTMTSSQLIEKKRLSIIQENGGPHQPSSSVRPYGELGDVFRRPIGSNHTNARVGNVIDSQRIYSALQRRIDENNRLAMSEGSECSADSQPGKAEVQRTCIEVTALHPHTEHDASSENLDDTHGMKVSKSIMARPSTERKSYSLDRTKEGYSDSIYRQQLLGMQTGLTPQETADRNESWTQSPKRPLRELTSTFFPSSMHIERSNTSPYRRAMKISSEEEDGVKKSVREFCNVESEDFPFLQITPNVTRAKSVTGTESIYSRTSSGNTPKPNTSSLSLAMPPKSVEPGSAVIEASQYKQPLSSVGQQSSSSVTLSGDWQKWMASQVKILQKQGEEKKRIFEPKFAKENGHRRESAQIVGDDVGIGKLQTFDERPKQPLGIIEGNAFSRPLHKYPTSRPMLERLPTLEIGQLAQPHTEHSEFDLATPPSKWSQTDQKYSCGRKDSALETLSLKHSYASVESPGSNCTPRPGQRMDYESIETHEPAGSHEARMRGLVQVKQMKKGQSRYSHERIARLRRRKSTNGLVSQGAVKLAPDAEEQYCVPDSQIIGSPAILTMPKDGKDISHEPIADVLDPLVDKAQASGGRKLVDVFLSNRRRHMGISEEFHANPAFL